MKNSITEYEKPFCSKCGGSGYFWDYDPESGKVVLILCDKCKGTGEKESEDK